MEKKIKEYVNKNDILNIKLTRETCEFHDIIYLNYLLEKNNNIFQIIISSNKYIIINFSAKLPLSITVSKHDILPYVNEIFIPFRFNKENILNIIKKSIKLEKLIIPYDRISEQVILKTLCEKQFLKYIIFEYVHDNAGNLSSFLRKI